MPQNYYRHEAAPPLGAARELERPSVSACMGHQAPVSPQRRFREGGDPSTPYFQHRKWVSLLAGDELTLRRNAGAIEAGKATGRCRGREGCRRFLRPSLIFGGSAALEARGAASQGHGGSRRRRAAAAGSVAARVVDPQGGGGGVSFARPVVVIAHRWRGAEHRLRVGHARCDPSSASSVTWPFPRFSLDQHLRHVSAQPWASDSLPEARAGRPERAAFSVQG